MKKRVALLLTLLFVTGLLWGQNAEEIMKRSRNRIEAKTVSTRARMVISAKDGSSTERLVDQYSSTEKEITKTVVVFQKPASVAGTRFLTIENPGKAADQWIYLPSLGKVRRIAASEGSASFMGTDLSYDDLSSADRDPDLDSYQLLREESLGGRPCWVIEARPKSRDYQYSKMLGWIDKENYIALKMELYDKRGNLAKIMERGEIKDIQGRLTPTLTKMSSVQAGTSTTIYTEIMKYDDPIPAGVFTERFLLTGRP